MSPGYSTPVEGEAVSPPVGAVVRPSPTPRAVVVVLPALSGSAWAVEAALVPRQCSGGCCFSCRALTVAHPARWRAGTPAPTTPRRCRSPRPTRHVLSGQPPLVIVVVDTVLVPIVALIVSLGAVVSTVAVTAAVVVVLPALSVALAVKLWLPSASARW